MTQNIEQSVQALNIIKIWWLMLNFEIDVMWLITGTDLIHTIKFVKSVELAQNIMSVDWTKTV